uniref:Putative 4-coumarate CoA ligase n=1 Tax=Davidia involucrata TaxID=16924 RepID=A0A5B6YHV7_DAVIN
MERSNPSIDPKSGFCSETKTFHSIRPPVLLPPETTPLSAASYALSLQQLTSPCFDSTALINSATGQCLSYSELTQKTKTLSASLQTLIGLSKGDTAFILSPNSTRLPILYLSLLSLGVAVSPANPTSTESEISRQIKLSGPVIAFASSTASYKLPITLPYKTILIDSPQFESMMMTSPSGELGRVEVSQSDIAAIMYSSGTTGQVKGVMLTHRNLIAIVADYYAWRRREERVLPAVELLTMPYFHVYGFFYSLKSVALSETVVVMERFDLKKMLRSVEEFRVTNVALSPPVVVAMTKGDMAEGYDLKSLEKVGCGGAPLGKDGIAAFTAKFPTVLLWQGYGLTESTGASFRAMSREESLRWGSVGKLLGNCEAKIIEPDTGVALPPLKQGELWIKGPIIMKGYAGDSKATSATLASDGWLRTGDLCFLDEEGFLFVVDRLKELIKYKGYQVPPAELEQLLQSHPEIVDAAVIPYPDEEAGQVPLAFVVRHPQSSLNEAQVMDFIAKQVAPYKKIRRVTFVSAIPKSASGKILRKELRKIATPESLSKL